MKLMLKNPRSVQSVYLYLILGNALAASFIWGLIFAAFFQLMALPFISLAKKQKAKSDRIEQ